MKRSLGIVAVLAAVSGCVTIPDATRPGQQTAQAASARGVTRAAAPDGPSGPQRHVGGPPSELPATPSDALPGLPPAAPLPGLPSPGTPAPSPRNATALAPIGPTGTTVPRPPSLPAAPPLPPPNLPSRASTSPTVELTSYTPQYRPTPATEQKGSPTIMQAAHSVQTTGPASIETALSGVPAGEKTGLPTVRVVDTAVRAVRSRRISLNFALKDVGPSGVSTLELWYTQDGKQWKMCEGSPKFPPFVVEVEEEGRYGFTLLARSGTGAATKQPTLGDEPQIWVLVDQTTPEVKLVDVSRATAGRAQALSVRWSATDVNLAPHPITLSYAERSEGPWHPIATNLPNTGHYLWSLPAGLPGQFLVRVEAADLANNVGTAQSASPILLDNSTPTVSILSVAESGGQ